MPTSNGQDDREAQSAADQEGPGKEAQAEDEDNAVVESIECPNCGHDFTGDYCPSCGQEADPSVSATSVVGGFFRELVDVEHGFWPTFVGLTLHPGETLRKYLSGVRKGLTSPGRYLLAAVVVGFGADQLFLWVGAKSSSSTSDPDLPPDATGIDTVVADIVPLFDTLDASQRGHMVTALLLIGPLAVLFYRLFDENLDGFGEALAAGSYMIAHAAFLYVGAELLYRLPAFWYLGRPVDIPTVLSFVFPTVYVGIVSYMCFGPGWKAALKGGFAMCWSFIELISIVFTASFVYGVGLVLTYPERYVPPEAQEPFPFPWELALVLSIGALVCFLPILLHAGVEAYYRYW